MKKFFAMIASVGVLASVAKGQVLLSGGLTYSQNFDSLASSSGTSTTVPWSDNTTILGWYATRSFISGTSSPYGPFTWTSYRTTGGEINNGSIYSFGTNGVNAIAERALGTVSSGTPKTNAFGLRIHNDTAEPVDTITVSYTGEQWRNGGNLAVQTLAFAYQVSSTAFTSPVAESNPGWTSVAALNFITPTTGAAASPLDGNAPANRIVFSNILLPGVTLDPGQEIFLRWQDIDDSGNDHGFGVDDFSVSASTVVPEPSTAILAALGAFALIYGRRFRR